MLLYSDLIVVYTTLLKQVFGVGCGENSEWFILLVRDEIHRYAGTFQLLERSVSF